jgi:hypothetical protein
MEQPVEAIPCQRRDNHLVLASYDIDWIRMPRRRLAWRAVTYGVMIR